MLTSRSQPRYQPVSDQRALRYAMELQASACVWRTTPPLRTEAKVQHLTRPLRMQSSTNAAVLRMRERDELLREGCCVAMEVRGNERATLRV
jgi:hypothetical protein